MFTPIDIKPNDRANIILFDTHDITINRGDCNNAEIVIYPCSIGRLTIRYAKNPYHCRIHLANGEVKNIHLSYEDDWGNVQQMNPNDWFKEGKGTTPDGWENRIGWGNDEDGHIEIVKVELPNGAPDGTEIPIEEFKRDVADFTIHYEG